MLILPDAALKISHHTYHVLNLLQSFKDRLDLVYRLDLECRRDDSLLQRGIGRRCYSRHIDAGIGDDCRHITQKARAIMSDNNDGGQGMLSFYLKPLDLDKALPILPSLTAQCAAVAAMNHDSLIKIEEACNCITWQRTATVGQLDEHLRHFTCHISAARMVSIFNGLRLRLHLSTVL